ncbi:hypothetical protein BDFG_01888 [Blastomyces dermatitidis ATCC 26199]|nr:hypothetical protein BDFG_01888 [Blastomyces dermatitidis ATCC 26199]
MFIGMHNNQPGHLRRASGGYALFNAQVNIDSNGTPSSACTANPNPPTCAERCVWAQGATALDAALLRDRGPVWGMAWAACVAGGIP